MEPLVELIESCVKSGWTISDPHGDASAICSLLPPEGDPRMGWCAMWEKVMYKGKIVLVPHWAAPGKYEEASWKTNTDT